MNILIVGCGKVGASLAGILDQQRHAVSIVDRHESSFERLDDDFSGLTVAGVEIDQDVLKSAGIEACDALAAVTSDDNVNIMVSQVAKLIFKVPKVLARIYDPAREDIFSSFGIDTLCPTNLTVATICSVFAGVQRTSKIVPIGSSNIQMTTTPVPEELVGLHISEIELPEDVSLFGVMHENDKVTLSGTYNIKLKETDYLMINRVVD
ncbi:potassium channel family protein [Candidatus Soleaferrea massiliensis]|uniref:potassium channel family protein n=1 Tax=Candidatus Soleaferrea massiliensis TaxID=1470354 RepID=UPI00058D08A9|nr:NAD-binding protein [Candidatus Soleaferrea massiliensis]